MGKGSRIKGGGYEREVVNDGLSRGHEMEKTFMSGANPGYKGDIHWTWPNGEKIICECKRFKNGLQKIYDALDQDNSVFGFFRKDHGKTIVAMYLEHFWELAEYKRMALAGGVPRGNEVEMEVLQKKYDKEIKNHKDTTFQLARMGNKVKDLESQLEGRVTLVTEEPTRQETLLFPK